MFTYIMNYEELCYYELYRFIPVDIEFPISPLDHKIYKESVTSQDAATFYIYSTLAFQYNFDYQKLYSDIVNANRNFRSTRK